MQNEVVDETGIYVSGSDSQLIGDSGIGISMSNLGVGNDIWAVTIPLLPGTYNYNFKNGQEWEDTNGLTDCGVGDSNNREFNLTNENLTLGPYCFSSCGDCNDLSNDKNEFFRLYNITHIYPNPFNPTVSISYSVHEKINVKIIIYDINGNEVEELVNNNQTIGNYKLAWDATNYPSGLYFVRIGTDYLIQTEKLIFIK